MRVQHRVSNQRGRPGEADPNVGIVEQIDDPNGWPGCADNEGDGWTFFDTQVCYPNDTALGSRAFVAVFSQKCPDGASSGCRNFGLFEVVSFSDPAFVSVPEDSRFNEFKTRVRNNNKGGFTARIDVQPSPPASLPTVVFTGTYTTVKEQHLGVPHRIEFEAQFNEVSASSQVVSIDGTDRPNYTSWNFSRGRLHPRQLEGVRRDRLGQSPEREDAEPNIENQDFPFRIPPPPQSDRQ